MIKVNNIQPQVVSNHIFNLETKYVGIGNGIILIV